MIHGHLKPSAINVLRLLQERGPRGANTHELCQPDVGGIRFGARLHEIREAGYVVHERYLRKGSHHYTLIEEADEAAA